MEVDYNGINDDQIEDDLCDLFGCNFIYYYD